MDDGLNENCRLRLHLIRHGETESNYAGLVLGQSDSPLTDRGVEQAVQSGLNFNFLDDIWLWYSSGLGRAKRTAHLISKRVDWKWDVRLRELGKGVREGQPKDLSYSQALALFSEENQDSSVPLLETEEDAMTRFNEWVQDLLRQTCNSALGESKQHSSVVKHVIAVSHSGMIRTIIQHICPEDVPMNAEIDTSHSDDKRRLKIPNLSRTVIDIIPDQSQVIGGQIMENYDIHWTAKLNILVDVSHLSDHLIS